MSCRSTQLAILWLALAGRAAAALSGWDETQLQSLQQYSTPLRWYNVEGAPYWVAGPEPRLAFGNAPRFFHVRPGEEITLRAAANTWLRLAGDTRALRPDDLEISVSSDGRGFVTAVPIATTHPPSLLIAMAQDKPSLVRLARPRSGSNLVFAAFFSLEEPFDTLAPYRDRIRLPGKATNLRRDDEILSEPTLLVKPEQGAAVSVKGPARVQLVARLPWPSDEPLREQSLVIRLKLDNADPLPLRLSPELDARHRTRVNHSTELVSQRMYGYFDVPAGKHRLRLQPTLPVYLDTFRQPRSEFLLPWLNDRTTNAPAAAAQPLRIPMDDFSIVFEFPPSISGARAYADRQQNAWRLALDNLPLDAAGQAEDWLNRLAQARRDYPEARQSAATLRRQRTFYREVLPALQPGDPRLQPLLFSPLRLRELFQPDRPVAVYHPTFEQVGDLLSAGQFAPVPPSASAPLLYQLPGRSYETQLRIAAIGAGPGRAQFFVQFDDEPPVKVALDSKPSLPPDEFEPSVAFATLHVLEQTVQLPANARSARPVGAFDLPFPVAEPGIVELPLPQHVRRVRIYGESSAAPCSASVAYRAARPFEFGEESFLSLLDQAGSNNVAQLFSSEPGPAAPESLRELHNHFLPLIRLLNAHCKDFTASVDSGSVTQRAVLSGEEAAKLEAAAAVLERNGERIEAMETWNRLFWESGARAEAALAIMRNLEPLDEDYLAMQYARYALLTGKGTNLPAPAVALLESDARQAEDFEQLEELRAFLFRRCPCPRHLAGLIEAFALNSRDEMVLSAGWLLPAGQRPDELMLAAALHLNWWQTFGKLVEALPQPEAKSFWRAQKDLALCHFTDAGRDLKQAGERGADSLRSLEEGMQIRQRLAAVDLKDRLDALFDWEQWQSHQPGPRTWRDADDVAYQCSATELLFNRERDQFVQFLRADSGKPVTLRFLGPLRLQIEARPVLGVPFKQPVDDWLEISEHGITNRVPVFQCVPNPGLQLTSTTNALAGVKTTANLDWGPGWHEVQVGLAGRTGLIRVQEEQPVLPARILPAINVERMNAVLAGRDATSPQPKGDADPEEKLWWVSPKEAQVGRVAPRAPQVESPERRARSGAPYHDISTNAALPEIQNLRLALRSGDGPAPEPEFSASELQSLPLAEQWLAAARWKRWSDFTNWNALPEMDRVNYLLATRHVREVLDSKMPRDIRQRLVTLLQVAENFPASRQEAQCQAESLAAATNCPPGCKNILVRLTQDLTWLPLPVSPSSAGIRPMQVRADLPQDPSARIRRALLPPADTNQFTVAAQNAFTATMRLQHPVRVQVRAELARAGFAPLSPLTVSLQVDDREVEHLPLTPLVPVSETDFDLAEGPRLVRLWIEDPVVNQFVRIGFSGQSDESEGATNSIWSQSMTQAATENRFSHAATTSQPIRFRWQGPALLRLDELRDGRFISQVRLLSAGEQSVEVGPAPGQAESWYRIFVRAAQTNQPEARPAWTMRTPEDVPPPRLRLPEAVVPYEAQLKDYYHLGGQEDGTWSGAVALVQRLPFEMDHKEMKLVNHFGEANATYRKQTPDETMWFATEALFRKHEPGDLTLGLTERVEGRPKISFLDWNWSAEAYGGTTGTNQQDTQASVYTAFEVGPHARINSKLEYYPFAGFFAHYLTASSNQVRQYDYIDQDLYTQFRARHRWGWVVGNQLEYQPWLDTVIRGYIDAASNEKFTPDYWGMRFTWSQLFGPLRGEAGYRFTHYLADGTRKNESWREGVSAGLFGEYWLNGRHRLEMGFQYRHDWPFSGDSYLWVLSWDFSGGRGYRDYSPRDMRFRDLRSRDIPTADNNHLQPGPPGASLP